MGRTTLNEPLWAGFCTRKVLLKWDQKCLYQAVWQEKTEYGCRSFFPTWRLGVEVAFCKESVLIPIGADRWYPHNVQPI